MSAELAVGTRVRLATGLLTGVPSGTEGVVIDRPDLTENSVYDIAVNFGEEYPAFLVYCSEVAPVAGDAS